MASPLGEALDIDALTRICVSADGSVWQQGKCRRTGTRGYSGAPAVAVVSGCTLYAADVADTRVPDSERSHAHAVMTPKPSKTAKAAPIRINIPATIHSLLQCGDCCIAAWRAQPFAAACCTEPGSFYRFLQIDAANGSVPSASVASGQRMRAGEYGAVAANGHRCGKACRVRSRY